MAQGEKNPKDSETLALGVLVGMPAIGILVFWLLKFVPMVCLGAGVGYLYFAATYQKNSICNRIRIGLLNFVFFTFVRL